MKRTTWWLAGYGLGYGLSAQAESYPHRAHVMLLPLVIGVLMTLYGLHRIASGPTSGGRAADV